MVRQGDTTFQDEATILPTSAVGSFTRLTTLGAGTQSVTGIGFRPSVIHMWANIDVSATGISVGFSNAINDNCTTWNGVTGWSYLDYTNLVVSIGNRPSWALDGTVQSMDADGFTMSWTTSGSPSGTATMGYMAVK